MKPQIRLKMGGSCRRKVAATERHKSFISYALTHYNRLIAESAVAGAGYCDCEQFEKER